MAVPAMAAMIATSAARSAAAKNAQEEKSKKKTTVKKPAPAKMPAMAKTTAKKAAAKQAVKKNPVSGKTVKTTTYNLLTPFKRNVKMVNERTTRKPSGRLTKEQIKNIQPKGPAKTTKKAPAKQPMGKLVGPAAVAELQRQVSPAGVKKAETGAKKAIDKKYPGLYKKSK
jgi:Flp pilus assembly protein TadG